MVNQALEHRLREEVGSDPWQYHIVLVNYLALLHALVVVANPNVNHRHRGPRCAGKGLEHAVAPIDLDHALAAALPNANM